VLVDVMAGASAGGLNGVIYAAAQVYGFDVASLRTAWLDLGDLGAMVRTPADDGASLLRGDAYFFECLRETLQDLIAGGRRVADVQEGARVDLTLTATLVEPAVRGRDDARLDVGEDVRFASTFRFRHPGGRWPSDFAAEPATAASRLALAARATSSFPVAFEGAQVFAPRRQAFADGPRPGAGRNVDMTGILGDARADGRPFVAMDGGVLDNIPLGRAITAVAEAPAHTPTRRFLLYVRPGGGGAGAATAVPDPGELRTTRGVVGAIVRSRLRPETIRGDLDLLEGHNEKVARSARLRRIAFDGCRGRAELRTRAVAAYPGYRTQRAEHDAQLIRRLLDDPVGFLCEDPFPVAGIEDRRWRAPLRWWPEEDVPAFDGDLADAFGGRLGGGGIERSLAVGVAPVARITRLLLDWVRFLEQEREAPVARQKARLYDALLVHADLVERIRRLAWVTLVARAGGRPPAVGAQDGAGRLQPWLDVVDGLLVTGDVGDPAGRDAVRTDLLTRLDQLATGDPATAPAAGADIRRHLLSDVLLPVARELAEARPAGSAEPPGPDALPGAWIDMAMGDGGGAVELADLAGLEVLAFGEALVGSPPSGRIDYRQLSSESRTPIAPAFEKLVPPGAAGRDVIPPDNKLAGNELKNFSAFLRRRWRENDWMWGRLDAVPTLVDLLVTAEGLAEGATSVESLLEELRDVVVEVDVEGDGWAAWLEEHVWRPRLDDIRAEVDAVWKRKSTGTGPWPPVPRTADAIIASRQWQVFAMERRLCEDGPPAATPSEVEAHARCYAIGTETLGDPPVEEDDALFRDVARAAQRALEHNLRPAPGGGGPGIPRAVGTTAGGLVRLVSWAWLDRSWAFWVPVVGLLLLVAGVDVAATAWRTDAGCWSCLWAALAVPGALLALGGAALAALRRRALAVPVVTGGVVLAAAGWTWGDNSLGVLAVGSTVLLLAAAALAALVGARRLVLPRRRSRSPAPR
jgi:hypothetical protein